VVASPPADNYGWRLLNITNQKEIDLNDPNGGTGALYLKVLTGADVTSIIVTVKNIYNDPDNQINIYYDASLTANGYLVLGGGTFNLNGPGTGQLIPY
jgi:hypothetical protein